MHAVAELDDAGTIFASGDEIVMVLRGGAGEVRNLQPRLSVDLDLDLVSTTPRPATTCAAQMRLSRETLGVAAEQVTDQREQLQESHARITVGRVRPIPQLVASTLDQAIELWPVRGASISAHWPKCLLMGAIIRASTAHSQRIGVHRGDTGCPAPVGHADSDGSTFTLMPRGGRPGLAIVREKGVSYRPVLTPAAQRRGCFTSHVNTHDLAMLVPELMAPHPGHTWSLLLT